MRNIKLLVTGGSGFIGANYILYILKTYPEISVINLDKLTYAGNKQNLVSVENNSRYMFVHGDICDANLVDSLMSKIDIVVHFAAESHVDRSIADPKAFIHTNIVGTYTLLESARKNGKKRFHHISTDEVFGSLGETGKFSEDSPYDPRSPYSASKAGSDHLVRAYFHTYGLPVTLSNCTNNYGPLQYPEKLIPLCITRLLQGKKVPVYGDGKNVRDWIYVEDHCEGIHLAVLQGELGKTYFFGGDSEAKNIDIVRMTLSKLGLTEDSIEFVTDRLGHDFRYAMDFSQTTKSLGWKPKTNLSDGLEKTIAWYKKFQSM